MPGIPIHLERPGIVPEAPSVTIRSTGRSKSILETPPPYTREWLDDHGLDVVYMNGRAVLQFKK